MGRMVVVEEMFKVIHVNKSTNLEEEKRWIEPRTKETYVRTLFKLIFFLFLVYITFLFVEFFV